MYHQDEAVYILNGFNVHSPSWQCSDRIPIRTGRLLFVWPPGLAAGWPSGQTWGWSKGRSQELSEEGTIDINQKYDKWEYKHENNSIQKIWDPGCPSDE